MTARLVAAWLSGAGLLLASYGTALGASDQALTPLTVKDVTLHFIKSEPQAFYPPEAQSKNVSGAAAALCTIDPTGNLADCAITSETPTGHGFGATTLKLVSLLQIDAAKDGSPVIGRKFLFLMKFRLR
ncbi:MAG: energy transducer TonB [Caulobacteraceae bacterium]